MKKIILFFLYIIVCVSAHGMEDFLPSDFNETENSLVPSQNKPSGQTREDAFLPSDFSTTHPSLTNALTKKNIPVTPQIFKKKRVWKEKVRKPFQCFICWNTCYKTEQKFKEHIKNEHSSS